MDAKGNVYIADRGNNRIQVLDNDLNFKTQYVNVGTPWTVCISPGAHQYLFSSNSNGIGNFDNGEIYKMELDGKIVGTFGEAGKQMKQFGSVHEIDCRNRERDSRRRAHELARAEAAAQGADEFDKVNPKSQNPNPNAPSGALGFFVPEGGAARSTLYQRTERKRALRSHVEGGCRRRRREADREDEESADAPACSRELDSFHAHPTAGARRRRCIRGSGLRSCRRRGESKVVAALLDQDFTWTNVDGRRSTRHR